MIIPIQIESQSQQQPQSQPQQDKVRIVPINLTPPQSYSEKPTAISSGLERILSRDRRDRDRDSTFGDILIPTLSKYFQLRDSRKKDFESLLAKEHPLKIESFKNHDDKYELQVNVQKFKPEEIRVKITDDFISILGEHEEKANKFNYTKQEFLRRYSLPDRVNANDIKCELSSDGYLKISAPKMEERVKITEIPIESPKAI